MLASGSMYIYVIVMGLDNTDPSHIPTTSTNHQLFLRHGRERKMMNQCTECSLGKGCM